MKRRFGLSSIRRESHSPAMHPLDRTFAEAMILAGSGPTGEALQLIQQTADARHPDGLFTLANCCWRGVGVSADLARARGLFKAAADAGQPMAVRAWTNLLSSGIAGRATGLRHWSDYSWKRWATAFEPRCSR